MTLLTIITAYSLVALLLVRPLAGHFAYYFHTENPYSNRSGRPDAAQWFGGVLLALCLAVVWPTALLWKLADARLPAVGAEREARLQAREKALREAERELGISA